MPAPAPNRATRRSAPKKGTAARATRAVNHPPADEEVQLWDEYVTEASPDVIPWRKRLPDGTLLEVGCPTSEQLDLISNAMLENDTYTVLTELFGEEQGALVMDLTKNLSFVVRLKMVNDVLMHYGMSAATLPESDASPT